MSPEVLRGGGYDWKSDVWSLGCIVYELAMLRNPFKEEGLNLCSLFQKISNVRLAGGGRGDFPALGVEKKLFSLAPSRKFKSQRSSAACPRLFPTPLYYAFQYIYYAFLLANGQGDYPPLLDYYSKELSELACSLMSTDPQDRPDIGQV